MSSPRIFITLVSFSLPLLFFFDSCKHHDDPVKSITPIPDSIAVLSKGLIGYYLFTGNTVDSSGQKNNAVDSGAVLTKDRNGVANQAYFFNGNDFVDLPVAPFENESYTFSLWEEVAVNPAPGDVAVLISIGQKDDTDQDVFPHQAISLANEFASADATGFNAGGYNISDNPRTTGAQVIGLPNTGEWHHLVGIRSSSELSLYIDGKVVAAGLTNFTSPDYGTVTSAHIGIRSNKTSGFNGSIDDVRIYNRALSDEEVTTLYWIGKSK